MTNTTERACAEFIGRQRALMLATVDSDGSPHASHAPFAIDDTGRLLVFVSNLSAHTANMRQHPKTSALLIDHTALAGLEMIGNNESMSSVASETVFAPNRLSLNCSVRFIASDNQIYARRIQQLRDRLGETMDTLASLPDFNLAQLTPSAGTFIQGFARAHPLDADAIKTIFSDVPKQ